MVVLRQSHTLLSGVQRDTSKSQVVQLFSCRGSSGRLCFRLSRRLMSKASAAPHQSSRLQRERKRGVVIIAVTKALQLYVSNLHSTVKYGFTLC